MKVLLLVTLLIATVFSQAPIRLECNENITEAAIANVLVSCDAELQVFGTIQLAEGFEQVEITSNVNVSVDCRIAVDALMRVHHCPGVVDHLTYNLIAGLPIFENDEAVSIIVRALVRNARRDIPAPGPGETRCTPDRRRQIRLAAATFLAECEGLDSVDDSRELCTRRCQIARIVFNEIWEACRDDINVVDVVPVLVRNVIAAVNRVCADAHRPILEECRSIDFRALFANVSRACAEVDNEVVDDARCQFAVRHAVPVVRGCLRLVRENREIPDGDPIETDDRTAELSEFHISEDDLRRARLWLRRYNINSRTVRAFVADNVITVRSTDELRTDAETVVTVLGFDAQKRFFCRLTNWKDGARTVSIRFSLVKIGCVRSDSNTDGADPAAVDDILEVDIPIDAEVEIQDIGEVAVSEPVEAESDIRVAESDDTAQSFIQRVPLGANRLGSLVLNHVCVSRSDGRRGVPSRPGVCKHTLTVRDFPRIAVEQCDPVFVWQIDTWTTSPPNVSVIDVNELEAENPDLERAENIPADEGDAREVSFGDRVRFRLRKWAYTVGLRLDVFVKCSGPVPSPVGLDENAAERRFCVVTLKRPDGRDDEITDIVFDPSFDSADEDSGEIVLSGTSADASDSMSHAVSTSHHDMSEEMSNEDSVSPIDTSLTIFMSALLVLLTLLFQ